MALSDCFAAGADLSPALRAPNRPDLTHRDFRQLVANTVEQLNGLGIGRTDRVAIMLPNGPEMAAACVAIAAGAAIAPLNPTYHEGELTHHLTDICAKAILVARDDTGPAIAAAKKLGIAVLRLDVAKGAASGSFTIDASPIGPAVTSGYATLANVALLLRTSGTTSRPKLVPLTHKNLWASARHIGDTLALTSKDCCLNIMPLFHVHGLIAAVLSSLAAGGSVFCTPGFNGLRFFRWLNEARPTWYTAVPTMHQAILARAPGNVDVVAARQLRFIRSSSAPLPPQAMRELERTFSCPVIESYGMTEAAHQVASNQLPPRIRKPGSVGLASGPEIAIMHPDGRLAAVDEEGEIVIRGSNVMSGYANDPDANKQMCNHGWLHTGDLGALDEDGYLRIAGRLNEIINRGGEKISPREVDEVLMDHPAIVQAVAFAVPHEKLGEEVGAAIVLRKGLAASEKDIRAFAAERLADFKVPRRLVFLDEIPLGITGKLQRLELSSRCFGTGQEKQRS